MSEERGMFMLHSGPSWNCPLCGIDNLFARTDCRVCMCPKSNTCSKCKKNNEAKARYCRFCGALTVFSCRNVFDPKVRKAAAKRSKDMVRRYQRIGHYFQWEDGPYQGLDDMYT